MNCVGIDVSKGKSMIAVMRPFGEVVVSPFEVLHTDSELSKLAAVSYTHLVWSSSAFRSSVSVICASV